MRSVSVISLISYFVVSPALAVDFYDQPYLLRLGLALERASNYSDTAARLASVAYPSGSSSNPAGDSFSNGKGNSSRVPLTMTSINALSESDTWITAVAISSRIDTNAFGSWSPAYAYTDTVSSENRFGLKNELESHEFFLGWCNSLSDHVSAGLQVRYVVSDVREESFSTGFYGIPLRADTSLSSADVSVGLMGKISDTFLTGAVISLGRASDVETEVRNISAVGSLPPLTLLDTVIADVDTRAIKLGIGLIPHASLGLYADLHYSEIETSNNDSIEITRLAAGIEYKLNPSMDTYIGLLIDSESEVTIGAGLGWRIGDDAQLHLTYQRNGAPEIKPEFGRIDFINMSLAINM